MRIRLLGLFVPLVSLCVSACVCRLPRGGWEFSIFSPPFTLPPVSFPALELHGYGQAWGRTGSELGWNAEDTRGSNREDDARRTGVDAGFFIGPILRMGTGLVFFL